MGLSAQDRARYARQLLLPQLGEAGQARLLAARLRPCEAADPGALEVAAAYLTRAGVQLVATGEARELAVVTTSELGRLAGAPELAEAARALAGALAAVHAIQALAQLGEPVSLSVPFAISSEDA